MEPLTLFAATVALVGVFHLLSTTVDHFGKGIYHRGNQQNKRDDWYCFFQLSDLLGDDQEVSKQSKQHQTVTEAERVEQRRKQQAIRPRLQA